MIVGQDEKQLGALLVPNVEQMLIWANERGLFLSEDFADSTGEIALQNLLKSEINKILSCRSGARSDERVAGVALVKPFTLENGLLTQTLKQRRNKIVEQANKKKVVQQELTEEELNAENNIEWED